MQSISTKIQTCVHKCFSVVIQAGIRLFLTYNWQNTRQNSYRKIKWYNYMHDDSIILSSLPHWWSPGLHFVFKTPCIYKKIPPLLWSLAIGKNLNQKIWCKIGLVLHWLVGQQAIFPIQHIHVFSLHIILSTAVTIIHSTHIPSQFYAQFQSILVH